MSEFTTEETYAHVLLTRFNCRFAANWTRLALDPVWLRHRFELFETYCLPSVRSQSCHNFHWIVFFDRETPVEFVDRLKKINESWWNPVFVGELTNDVVLSTIRSKIHPQAKFVITTRLDNDDAISDDFISRVQAGFGHHREYLCFPSGFILNRGRLFRHHDPHNAFVSLVEPCQSSIDGVWKMQHTDIAKHAPVRQLEGGPGWIQVVHDKNVSNKVRGIRCSVDALGNTFALDKAFIRTPGLFDTLLDSCILRPYRSSRDWLATCTRSTRKSIKRMLGRA